MKIKKAKIIFSILPLIYVGFSTLVEGQHFFVKADDTIGSVSLTEIHNGDVVNLTGNSNQSYNYALNDQSLTEEDEVIMYFILDNFTLENITNGNGCFNIFNNTFANLNIFFQLNGTNRVISNDLNYAPFNLVGIDNKGENINSVINLYFTMSDTRCTCRSSLEIGYQVSDQFSHPLTYRESCIGDEQTLNCRANNSESSFFTNAYVNPSINILFRGDTNHSFEESNPIDVIDPTCSEYGQKIYFCDLCKEEIYVEIPLLEHSWTLLLNDDSYIPPTCSEYGMQEYICLTCQEIKTEEIEFAEHSYEIIDTIPATCTELGKNILECSECGNKSEEDIPRNENHNWPDWETIVKKDCDNPGYLKRTCLNCGLEDVKISESAGHKFEKINSFPSTCITPGYLDVECVNCGYFSHDYIELNPSNHEGVTKLVIDEAATTEKDGLGHYEWSCCGQVDEDSGEVIVPKITLENTKDLLKEVMGVKDNIQDPSRDEIVEALTNVTTETAFDIAIEINKSYEEIANLGNITAKDKQEYIETLQYATEGVIITGSKLNNFEDDAISQRLPENVSIEFDTVLQNFFQLQYDLILGRALDSNNSSLSAPYKATPIVTNGINYTEGSDVYKNIGNLYK